MVPFGHRGILDLSGNGSRAELHQLRMVAVGQSVASD
jgi:hypothetical protein